MGRLSSSDLSASAPARGRNEMIGAREEDRKSNCRPVHVKDRLPARERVELQVLTARCAWPNVVRARWM